MPTLIPRLRTSAQTVASAVAAIAALSGAPIGGPALRLEFAKTGTPSRVICVTNLSRAFSRDQWAAQFAVRTRASSSSATPTSRCGSLAPPGAREQACERYLCLLCGHNSHKLTCFSRAQIYGAIQSLSFNDLTGSALVEYSTIGEAVSANNALQGQAIAGQELKVAFETVGGPPQPPGRANASASAPGAPAVVSRPSLTCTPLHSRLESRAASHPALRFAIPLRRCLQSHVMSRQPPVSILCSIHKQTGAC